MVGLREILDALGVEGLTAYTDQIRYANVRLARAIIAALGLRCSDSVEDWRILCSMSPHMLGLTRRRGLRAHEVAIAMRDAMREALDYPRYSFLDLSCFLCLMPA